MKKGKLHELFVDEAGARRRFVWSRPSTPRLQAYFDRLGITLPEGYETEVNLAMSDWLDAGRLGSAKGTACTFHRLWKTRARVLCARTRARDAARFFKT